MKDSRKLLPLLLCIAAIPSVHAQSIVKINPGASECDVINPQNGEIFSLDAQGNVVITGTLTGAGCGTGGGGNTYNSLFSGLSPAPLTVNGSTSASILVGSGTGTVAYSAYLANSCSVGVSAPSGTCPAVSVSNAACTGAGSYLNCAPTNGSVSIPASIGTNSACNYTLTATCQPGATTSTAGLSVTASGGGGGGDPVECTNVAKIGTGTSGQFWNRLVGNINVKYGDGTTVSGIDSTTYTAIWNLNTSFPWPGNSGFNVRPTVPKNTYLAEAFTTPASFDGQITWSTNGSGSGTAASYSISVCPGDFGQTGTQLQANCKANIADSGVGAQVGGTSGAYCVLQPNTKYYLNVLSQAPLPSGDVSRSSCTTSSCTPWTVRH